VSGLKRGKAKHKENDHKGNGSKGNGNGEVIIKGGHFKIYKRKVDIVANVVYVVNMLNFAQNISKGEIGNIYIFDKNRGYNRDDGIEGSFIVRSKVLKPYLILAAHGGLTLLPECGKLKPATINCKDYNKKIKTLRREIVKDICDKFVKRIQVEAEEHNGHEFSIDTSIDNLVRFVQDRAQQDTVRFLQELNPYIKPPEKPIEVDF